MRWTRTARRCRPSLADRWRPHRGVDGRSAGFGHRPGTTAPGSVSPAIRIGLGCRLGAAGSGLKSAQAPPAVLGDQVCRGGAGLDLADQAPAILVDAVPVAVSRAHRVAVARRAVGRASVPRLSPVAVRGEDGRQAAAVSCGPAARRRRRGPGVSGPGPGRGPSSPDALPPRSRVGLLPSRPVREGAESVSFARRPVLSRRSPGAPRAPREASPDRWRCSNLTRSRGNPPRRRLVSIVISTSRRPGASPASRRVRAAFRLAPQGPMATLDSPRPPRSPPPPLFLSRAVSPAWGSRRCSPPACGGTVSGGSLARLARAFAILNLLFAILGMLSLAPISAHAQNPGRDDGETGEGVYAGRVVVLGAVVELPALDAPAPRRQPRCRPRPRLLSPMLLAHTGLQLADAHSTLRGLAPVRSRRTRAPIAQWAVRSSAQAYVVSAAATGSRGGARASLPAITPDRRSGPSSPSTGSTQSS